MIATLRFQPAYEPYIKHYPLSEARHRKELKRNPAYREFLQAPNQDARIKKRDLVTFLSRPVTRLPRLSLLLETLLKRTDEEHPDQESIKLITGILSDFVKSTQPGIEAAESKVKYFGVMENLVFKRGEICVSHPAWNRFWYRSLIFYVMIRIWMSKMRAGRSFIPKP